METRKYFLDWLRVIAFGALIVFHVGLLYASWPYNLKSPHLLPGIDLWLLALTPWRLAILFFISGAACRFLIAKLGSGRFALDRLRRLVPTILFGMFVVIPPQTYVELIAKGVTHQDYLTFWLHEYLPAHQALVAPLHKTMPTWDHLWFLVYLLLYALFFALLYAIARPREGRPRLPLSLLLVAPAICLAVSNLVILKVAPITDALVNDWGGHLKWISMFATGVLAARRDDFWETLRRHRAAFAALAAALFALQSRVNDPVWSAVSGLYGWAAICAACGYASRYLDKPSPVLSHLNEAILPIYVLHQPILLIAAFYIFPLRLPLFGEAAALVAITAVAALMIYGVAIRPFGPTRFVFGLKP